MRSLRAAITREQAERAGRAVAEHVAELPAFADAAHVALFASLSDELPTRPVFDAALASGKLALFPRVEGARLVFAPVGRWEDLRPGRYGVAEPPHDIAALVPDALVLVPGVAFDARGGRLGRGGGYYDRTFASDAEPRPLLLGVGYAFQVVDAVPEERHDRRMDGVMTERGIRWAEGGR
jgi:5-formyltetrahydrofolate cyclo-ligase